MRVVIFREVTKPCPYRDELDRGWLFIEYTEHAPELHALAAFIDRYNAEPMTHEDYTNSLHVALLAAERIVTIWNTGPWQIVVESDLSATDG